MSTVKICDMCKKEIRPYRKRLHFKYKNTAKISDIRYESIDLCPNCVDKIMNEIKQSQKEGE